MNENRTTRLNALTVDVEDYFHTEAMRGAAPREEWDSMPSRVRGNTQRVYELLAHHDVRATIFFLGWVAERFPDLVCEAVGLGHEVGCHSYWHRPVYTLSPAEFRADTNHAKAVIEDAGSVRVRGYRAPSFSLIAGTEWAAEILAELGFSYDSSVNPIRHDIYGNAHAPRLPHRIAAGALWELPVATVRCGGNNVPVGGGAYLRILPYRYTHWGLSRINGQEGQPAVVYLHPWEIDSSQPRLAVGLKSRLRQYSCLGAARSKIERLLNDFSFAPISEVFRRELGGASTLAENRSAAGAASVPRPPSAASIRPTGLSELE